MRSAQHVVLPTVIDAPGSYRTRGGETVTVVSVDHGRAHGYYSNAVVESWDVSGRLLPFSLSRNDIVSIA